ncbi:MAG: hypothetical protein IJC85_04295 [Oscillospiraceae bacterium]|nr:hypothetical protein [Oscillospiraceae bacterium]
MKKGTNNSSNRYSPAFFGGAVFVLCVPIHRFFWFEYVIFLCYGDDTQKQLMMFVQQFPFESKKAKNDQFQSNLNQRGRIFRGTFPNWHRQVLQKAL